MGYGCKVLADSVSPEGVRLTTLEVTFPRIVLAEFNTHRTLSRNSPSSRAIPVEKRIAAVEADPFVPATFGKNRPGMQAEENLDPTEAMAAWAYWGAACAAAVEHARFLAKLGVHKQLANRLLEPFSWHTVIVTATEWANFFALRCHPAAQPEIRTAANLMFDAMATSAPTAMDETGWHLPLVPDVVRLQYEGFGPDELCRIAIGRCARVSYLTHDGVRDPRADLDLANRLQASGHMSPFEHVARPQTLKDPETRWSGNFRGWVQYRKGLVGEEVFRG